jgi:hypothetical protein
MKIFSSPLKEIKSIYGCSLINVFWLEIFLPLSEFVIAKNAF